MGSNTASTRGGEITKSSIGWSMRHQQDYGGSLYCKKCRVHMEVTYDEKTFTARCPKCGRGCSYEGVSMDKWEIR